MTPTRFPLSWPAGWKRTPPAQRTRAKFATKRHGSGAYGSMRDLTIADGLDRVLKELRALGVVEADLVVSTNMELRMDGYPRSDRSPPSEVGVAVYWRKGGKDQVMAADHYDGIGDNLAAIAATLEALRTIERHGGSAIIERAYTGFTALPAPIVAGMKKPWRDVLEFFDSPRAITAEDVQARYRRLASVHHPDKGGSDAKMAEISAARDEALQELAR